MRALTLTLSGGGEAPVENPDAAAAGAAAPKLAEVGRIKAVTDMALCVDWAPGAARGVAAVSSSGGQITLVQAAEGGLRRLNEWVAHELEGCWWRLTSTRCGGAHAALVMCTSSRARAAGSCCPALGAQNALGLCSPCLALCCCQLKPLTKHVATAQPPGSACYPQSPSHLPSLPAPSSLQPNMLYSGADDCTFKGWDCRAAAPAISWHAVPESSGGAAASGAPGGGSSAYGSSAYGRGEEEEDEDEEEAQLAMFSNRTHAAGVCCIAPHPSRAHLVATGSYDERIRLWDMRKATKPLVAAQVGKGLLHGAFLCTYRMLGRNLAAGFLLWFCMAVVLMSCWQAAF